MTVKKIFADKNLIMFVKFSVVGATNTVLDAVVFFLMCDICGIHEIISNITAYIISATNSYLLNSRFVFREGKYTYKSYLKFLSANTFVLVISTLSVFLLSQRVSYKITAKLISIPITVIIKGTSKNSCHMIALHLHAEFLCKKP